MQIIEVPIGIARIIPVFMRGYDSGLGQAGLASVLFIQAKKSGSAFATITPAITDRGSGWYDFAFTAPMFDTYGFMPLRITGITGPGQPPVTENDEITISVVALNKYDGMTAGLAALPNSAAGTPSGVALASDVTGGSSTVVSAIAASTSTLATDISAGTTTTTNAITASTSTLATDISAGTTTTTNAITASQAAVIAAMPSAAVIRDAILNAARSGHVAVGSVGEGIAIATSLLQGNFYMDTVVNSDNGQTSARMRCFHTGTAAGTATPGGSGEGEFATFVVTTSYNGPNKIVEHRVVQQ